ncbi:MAG: hypothetical protein KatS3mg002_1613 [Candidatus Woesearchaeota archaeon]|nr:MAG: hypothetical protein KatS3mg002_1613 [Candidatus Woesearchaeota archaeon]
MPLRELRSIYEKRKANLVELLEKNPKLDPARQHQIYGAICEIDILLKTIDHLREQEIRDNYKLDKKAKNI